MRIAILGDIHGNLPALRAAYERALKENAGEVLHLGDLGGYAPFVNEVVDFIRTKGIKGVQGNYDYNVANNSEHCGCKYEDPVQAELAQRSFDWTKERVSEETRAFMRALPERMESNIDGKRLCLFHATPHKNNIYWFDDRPDRFFLEMAGRCEADVYVYGHTHIPYRRDIEGKVFINAGSVGKPKDGDPRACLTLVDIDGKGVRSEFIRVEYDVEAVTKAIGASSLPVEFARKLREAR